MPLIPDKEDSRLRDIIDGVYRYSGKTIIRIKPLAEEIAQNIDRILINIKILKEKQAYETINVVSSLAQELKLLISTIKFYLEQVEKEFRTALRYLTAIIDNKNKQSNIDIIGSAILIQRGLLEELEYIETLTKNIQAVGAICVKFSNETPNYRENIQEAAQTEKISAQLIATKSMISSLLLNEESSIAAGIKKIGARAN